MEPYVGQISMVAFPFAPKGWALCNGSLLSINQNQALFAILGTTYGGDGVTTFKLPDLRGRAPVHSGSSNPLGSTAGVETVTLNSQQIPFHTHLATAVNTAGTTASPSGGVWAASTGNDLQYAVASDAYMAPNASGPGGSKQPHENMQPGTVVNFIIALQGVFPSRD